MARYKVLRDCAGFRGGYWNEGQIVEVANHETPPRHFELIEGKEPEPIVAAPAEPQTMSEINKVNESNRPTTGMAHVPAAAKSVPETRAKSVKSGKK